MAVDVKLGAAPEIGAPTALFKAQFAPDGTGYAPLADGPRFLFVEPTGEVAAPKINVALNWTAELKR
jgi:hypothetical protein